MKSEQEKLKEWVDNWKTTGEVLEKLRIDEMRKSDTYQSMLVLNDAFNAIVASDSIRSSSGLVEQQKWFTKFRENDSTN
jgi:hypothetical protein